MLLLLIIESCFFRIVEFLIDKFKASIYDRTKDGSTLMHIASVNGHSETATLLYNRGVNIFKRYNFYKKLSNVLGSSPDA